MSINIYINDKDKQWIELAKKIAAKKDWSLSKVIKFIMKKTLIEGALEIKEEPLLQRVEKRVEESKPETKKVTPSEQKKKEKISPNDIFKEIEKEQTKEEEEIKSNKDKSMEELALECKKKELQPSGKYICHYKDQLKVLYPVCVVCWTLEEIWGEKVYK